MIAHVRSLLDRLTRWRPDRQFRNLGWFGIAEACVRVSRLVTVVVLARTVAAVDLGTAALALMLFELVRAIGTAGLGQMIVRARDDNVGATCAAVWRAAWLSATAMVMALGLLAALLPHQGTREAWGLMIASLAAVYLLSPLGLIQQSLIMRSNRLGAIAAVSAVTVIADCLLTAVLAFSGLGAAALVLPKLLVAPIWVVGMRRAAPAAPTADGPRVALADVWLFVMPVMGTEALAAVRQNADKFLVGVLLGPAALGTYYLAYNAGVGLSMILTSALAATVYPHLAEVANRPADMLARVDRLLWRHGAVVTAVIAVQAAAIPLYVPLLLGAAWTTVPLLAAVLCVGALTKPAYDILAQSLRAVGATQFEFVGSLLFTGFSLGSLFIGLHGGLTAGVAAFAIATAVGQLACALVGRAVLKARSVERVPSGAAMLPVAA